MNKKEKTEKVLELASRPEGVISSEGVETGLCNCHRSFNNMARKLLGERRLKRARWDWGGHGGWKWIYHTSNPTAAVKIRTNRESLIHRLTERNDGSDERLLALIPEVMELTGVTGSKMTKALKIPESFLEKAVSLWREKPTHVCHECGWRGKNPQYCESWDSGRPKPYYRCLGCGMII